MSEILLHHYPQSPVAEKVRTVLGIKNLSWCSVQIPRLPPKPDLVPLTGGYRRTPVMQIGADIFCDSLCIIAELERRFPKPSLFPDGRAGLAWGLSRWTDNVIFPVVLALVLGREGKELPQDFAADRGRLYFGPDFDLQRLIHDLPGNVAQVRGHLAWMNSALGAGPFMHGTNAGFTDALCHHIFWFVAGRYRDSASLLKEFPSLLAWEQRVVDIGHGRAEEKDAAEALTIARDSSIEVTPEIDTSDPSGLVSGQLITVVPIGDGGDPEVKGELLRLTLDEVVIRRRDPRAGEVAVHFPRMGYRVFADSQAT